MALPAHDPVISMFGSLLLNAGRRQNNIKVVGYRNLAATGFDRKQNHTPKFPVHCSAVRRVEDRRTALERRATRKRRDGREEGATMLDLPTPEFPNHDLYNKEYFLLVLSPFPCQMNSVGR